MNDTETTPVAEVAPQTDETRSEQVATTEEVADAPAVAADQEERLYAGKFKSPEDMEKSYTELQSKFTKTAQEKAEIERFLESSRQAPEQASVDVPDLDPESAAAVDRLVERKLSEKAAQAELKKAQEFRAKHADELADPVLDGTVLRLMQEARQNQTYLDQEDALAQAKQLLDARIKPQVKEAQIQGEREGAGIAQKKAELGKVGETASAQKVNPDELSADEYAKFYNIPRA